MIDAAILHDFAIVTEQTQAVLMAAGGTQEGLNLILHEIDGITLETVTAERLANLKGLAELAIRITRMGLQAPAEMPMPFGDGTSQEWES